MYFPIIICFFTTESSQQGPIETVEQQLLENFHRAYNNPPTGPISLRSALTILTFMCKYRKLYHQFTLTNTKLVLMVGRVAQSV